MNIAVIQMSRVAAESQRGKALSGSLRSTADKWNEQIAKCQHKLRETAERQAKLGDSANPEVEFRLQRDRVILEIELRSLQERMRFDVDSHRDFFRKQLVEEMRSIVQKIAQEKQLDLVIPVDGRDDVSYASSACDLTSEAVRLFDADG